MYNPHQDITTEERSLYHNKLIICLSLLV